MIELPRHYHTKWRNVTSWYIIYQPTFLFIPYSSTIIGISTSITHTLKIVEMHQKFRGEN